MRIRPQLILWQWRQCSPLVHVYAMVIALLFITCYRPLLHAAPADSWVFLFILVHSFLAVAPVGRFREGHYAYLSTRGYGSGAIWLSGVLASLACVMLVWLPVSLAIWTGARSAIQDALLNPNFPVFAGKEAGMPWYWLEKYALFTAALHYAWVRKGQRGRDGEAGFGLLVGLIFTSVILHTRWWRVETPLEMLQAVWRVAALGIALLLLAWSRVMHRSLEVTP